ncbi:predicted protein [Fibroporia radiculosa]|nr:predicted protein [Fibroporia radiculosa]
MSDSVYY